MMNGLWFVRGRVCYRLQDEPVVEYRMVRAENAFCAVNKFQDHFDSKPLLVCWVDNVEVLEIIE